MTRLSAPSDDSLRVLYVNSDPDFTELVRTKLKRTEFDIHCASARNLDAALDVLSSERIDCVVTAYSLLEETGIALSRSIRQQDDELPIILFTGKGDEEVASEATRAGVSDYIPIRADRNNFELLAGRIRTLSHAARERRAAERASTQLHRTLERTTDAVYAVDTEWRIEYMNETMAERVDRNPDTIVGEMLWEEFPSIVGTELEERYRTAMETGEPVSFEQRLGDPFDYWIEVRAFPDEDGLTIFSQDITNERERQLELERNEAICQTIQDIVFVLDEDETVRFANPAAARVLGDTESNALEGTQLSTLVGDRVPESDAEAFIRAVDETLRERRADGGIAASPDSDLRIDVATPTGQRTFNVRLTPFQASERPQVVVLARDITSQHEIRQELERQQFLFDRVQEIADIGIWEYVPSTGELDWSDGVRRIHAVEPEYDPDLSDALEFYPPEDRETITSAVERAIEDGESYDLDLRIVRSDGEIRNVRAWGEPVDSARQEEEVIRGVFQDITERKQQEREYQELAEEYGALLETSGDAIFLVDVDMNDQESEFRFARLSPGYETQTGITTEDVRGRTPRDVFGDEQGAELESNYRRCVTQRKPISYREELPVAEDARFWETNLAPVVVDGEIVRVVGIARNVTEQVERERELEATNQRLESLIETAPLPIMEIDTDGAVVLWNEGAEEMFGWSREEVIGEFNPMVPDDRQAEFETNRQRALNGDRIHGKEIQRETKDGERLDLLLSVAPLTDPDGDVSSVLAILENITEQKRLETRLRSLQETAQQLSGAESSDEIGTIAVDAAVEILGLDITGLWEYNDREDVLVPVTETPAARALFGESPRFAPGGGLAWDAFESGEIQVYDDVQTENRVHNPNTEIRSEIFVPLGDYGLMSTGSVSTQVFSETDVDLFRILGATVESALARASREAELHRQNERLDQFASVVAHDLRNPLNVAMGFLEIAEETGDAEHFETVESAHDRIERLIEDLLTLARGETTIEDTDHIDLESITTEAWGYVDTKEAALTVTDDVPTVTGDGGRLTQVFENLFRNAVEHGGADVTVTVGRLDGDDGFYVEDNGSGIPPESRDEVFKHGVTSSEGGTGFGLSIVADIAKAHGWTVSVTDGTDGGARFEFKGSK
ncbi:MULTISPECIES: PAS domain-containing protein [Salinirubellus]|uniref:PAS domain-containing protein n=1 Tax=Salinirubellus TaxID=2162630 RepID=UPI0030CFEC94